jgi:uncharacterized delta-60 repeat protein
MTPSRLVFRMAVAFLASFFVGSISGPVDAHDAGLGLLRYNADGSLDATFGRGGVVAERTPQGGLDPEALVIQADGKIVLAGTASDLPTAVVGFGVARYNADGSPDSAFGTSGRVLTRVGAATSGAHAVALQSDGRLVLAGSAFANSAGEGELAVVRYTSDGTPDPAFGVGGMVLTQIGSSSAEARGIAVQSDGRIVVAGTVFSNGATDDDFALARYEPDGTLDRSFGNDGILTTDFGAAASGTPDRLATVLIQPDGKIIAVGSSGGHQGKFAIARYTSNGALDQAFGTGGKIVSDLEGSAQAYAAAGEPGGKIVVAGGLGSADNVAFVLARYTSDGNLDTGFGSGGIVTTSFDGGGSGARALTIRDDGKILAVGSGYGPGAGAAAANAQQPVNGGFAAARFLPDGTRDTQFGMSGTVVITVGDAGSMPAALGVQADGKLVAAGLTYFLVPTPNPNPLFTEPKSIIAFVGFIVLAALIARRLRRAGRLNRARSADARIGPAPEPSYTSRIQEYSPLAPSRGRSAGEFPLRGRTGSILCRAPLAARPSIAMSEPPNSQSIHPPPSLVARGGRPAAAWAPTW